MNQYYDELEDYSARDRRDLFRFDDEENKEDERENDEKSLGVINKLLGVFFEEWSNS